MLSPSDRIRLITEIGRRLAAEEWAAIDLALRQFGQPTADQWPGGNKVGYVIEMIDRAPDEVLEGLAQHVSFEHRESRPGTEPAFWRQGYFRLFLSHLSTFRSDAGELQKEAVQYGISSFVAHKDIEPTKEWQNEIESALASCDALVALLHPGFHASNWTDQEVGYVMGRNRLIATIRYGHDPYGFIGRFQAFQGSGKTSADLARELSQSLCKHKQTRRRMAEALVARLEASNTFAEAKASAALLEEATYWDAALTRRVRDAVKANVQISEAWNVPDRLEGVITRLGGGA